MEDERSGIIEMIPDEWIDEWKERTRAKTGGPTSSCIPPVAILDYLAGRTLTSEQEAHLRSCAYCQEVEKLLG